MNLKIHVTDFIGLCTTYIKIARQEVKFYVDFYLKPVIKQIIEKARALAPPARFKNLIDRFKKGGTK